VKRDETPSHSGAKISWKIIPQDLKWQRYRVPRPVGDTSIGLELDNRKKIIRGVE
jgi:hypothetical protein